MVPKPIASLDVEEVKIEKEKKNNITRTFFNVFWPTLMLAIIAILNSDIKMAGIAFVLAIAQFFVSKQFVEDYENLK